MPELVDQVVSFTFSSKGLMLITGLSDAVLETGKNIFFNSPWGHHLGNNKRRGNRHLLFSWTAAVIWREMGDGSWLQRKVITGHYYLSLSLWVYVVQDHRVQWTCDAHMLSKLRRRWSTLVAFGCSGSVLQSFSPSHSSSSPPLSCFPLPHWHQYTRLTAYTSAYS